jgi:hypothetical protein
LQSLQSKPLSPMPPLLSPMPPLLEIFLWKIEGGYHRNRDYEGLSLDG